MAVTDYIIVLEISSLRQEPGKLPWAEFLDKIKMRDNTEITLHPMPIH